MGRGRPACEFVTAGGLKQKGCAPAVQCMGRYATVSTSAALPSGCAHASTHLAKHPLPIFCAAFRRLRDVFGINTSEYLLSICGDQALRELPSPGKSGRCAGSASGQGAVLLGAEP